MSSITFIFLKPPFPLVSFVIFHFCTLVVPSVIVASQCKAFIVWLPENTYVTERWSLTGRPDN